MPYMQISIYINISILERFLRNQITGNIVYTHIFLCPLWKSRSAVSIHLYLPLMPNHSMLSFSTPHIHYWPFFFLLLSMFLPCLHLSRRDKCHYRPTERKECCFTLLFISVATYHWPTNPWHDPSKARESKSFCSSAFPWSSALLKLQRLYFSQHVN